MRRQGSGLLFRAAGLLDRRFAAAPARQVPVPPQAAASGNGGGGDASGALSLPKIRDRLNQLAKTRQLTGDNLKKDTTLLNSLDIPLVKLLRIADNHGPGPAALSHIWNAVGQTPQAAPPAQQQQQQQQASRSQQSNKAWVKPSQYGKPAAADSGSTSQTINGSNNQSQQPWTPPSASSSYAYSGSNGSSSISPSNNTMRSAATAPPPSAQPDMPSPSPSSSFSAAPDTSGKVSIRDALNQQKIFLSKYTPGTHRLICPKCKGGSKDEPSFTVTIEDNGKSASWNCFRATCGFSGGTHVDKPNVQNDSGFFVSTTSRKRKEEPPVRPTVNFEDLTPEMVEFFKTRGISEATLSSNKVQGEVVYDPGRREKSPTIAFPYYRDGKLINVKYRSLDKRFWQVRGAEKVLYGLDDIANATEVIIVEGEMDKLALYEAGITNVVSVPDGAPARVREGDLPPAAEDTKYSYLWNCRAWLDQATRILIATDNDAPGDALAEELARRLGKERCWRVRWPLTLSDHEYAADTLGTALPMSLTTPHVQEEKDSSSTSSNTSVVDGVNGVKGTTTADADDASTSSGTVVDDKSPSLLDNLLGVPTPTPITDVNSTTSTTTESATDTATTSSTNGTEAAAAAAIAPTDPAPGSQLDMRYYRKDANEVLIKDGSDFLKAFVANAEAFPIRGLLRFHEYYEDIVKHYYLQLRDGQGVSTGWTGLDEFYKVVPGELTIVTGVPNSGKSEFIDALLSNLSEQHGWTFAMCSMEKKAIDHARQLAEKYVGLPFFDLPYARGVPRMSIGDLEDALDWVDDRFHLIRYEDDQLPHIDWVLEVAKAAVYRYGIRGLVIDPYNELDHQRPSNMNETEYVSQMLTKVKRFAQTSGVHVWFVAHPRQMREWKGQAPNLYDISGSAHFINKADNGIVVHRVREQGLEKQVQILVRKVRNKAAGTIGDCILEYERRNGRYLDPNGGRAPRTSQRVVFPASSNGAGDNNRNGNGSMNDGFTPPRMYHHQDGTVSSDPPYDNY